MKWSADAVPVGLGLLLAYSRTMSLAQPSMFIL